VTLGRAAADPANTLDVRENDWILVGGWSGTQRVFKWYRVIAAEPPETAGVLTRRATLAGPDWSSSFNFIDTDGNGSLDASRGVLFTGVAGVYSEVVSINR